MLLKTQVPRQVLGVRMSLLLVEHVWQLKTRTSIRQSSLQNVHLLAQSDVSFDQLMQLLRIECSFTRTVSCMRLEACNGISDQ